MIGSMGMMRDAMKTEAAAANRAVEAELDWQSEGVSVPHGTEARMSYMAGRQTFVGCFLNGKLVVNGRHFTTLSQAASALAVNRMGRSPNLNGWAYWQVRLPGTDHWIPMATLKKSARRTVLDVSHEQETGA
jgi:hypothetical protein